MDKSYIYMILALMAGISFVFIVPKEQYKKTLVYGIILGGLFDAAIATVLTLTGLIKYKATGPFDVLGIFSVWTPIGWTYTFAIFFYLLPVRRLLIVPYLIAFTGLSYSVGLSYELFGLFEYIGIQRYLAPLIFFAWFGAAAWIYYKLENIVLI